MEKYETPIMEVFEFEKRIDTVIESIIEKDDENHGIVLPNGF